MFPPNHPPNSLQQGDGFNFRIDVFDWDPTSSDDFMGTYKMTYQELTSKQGLFTLIPFLHL